MSRVEVVRTTDLMAGDSTDGITRERAFASDTIAVSRTRIPPGATSRWHHHAERHLYGFLVTGLLRLEYGPGGTLAAEVRPGDFFHIPPRLMHRDVNRSRDEDSVVVNVLTGRGVTLVNVNDPDSS